MCWPASGLKRLSSAAATTELATLPPASEENEVADWTVEADKVLVF